jgi:DnaK suppressor protein
MAPIRLSTALPPSPGAIAPAQLAALRAQLEEQRRFRLDQLSELRALDPAANTDVSAALAAGARVALADVLAALHRMDTGSYGVCTDCGTPLPLDRLEVLPQVGQCLECRTTGRHARR